MPAVSHPASYPRPVVSGRAVTPEARLFERNTGLIRATIARRYPFLLRDPETEADAWSAAALGLLKAARDYDPSRGVTFATCASAYIVTELYRHIRAENGPIRRPTGVFERQSRLLKAERSLRQSLGRAPDEEEIATEARLTAAELADLRSLGPVPSVGSLDAPLGIDASLTLGDLVPDPSPSVESQTLGGAGFDALLSRLANDRHREVITALYVRGETLSEAARRLGVGRERTRQIHAKALETLRAGMQGTL